MGLFLIFIYIKNCSFYKKAGGGKNHILTLNIAKLTK